MRSLARELGLSPATVSLALRDDARICRSTTERVKALAATLGYHADPVVAEGLSRVRRRDFYRETLAWLLDRRAEDQPWVGELFAAAVERGRALGYQIEFFPVDCTDAAALRRAARVWRARGIRGVLVGPLKQELVDPPLPWDEFSWVTIGQSLVSPAVHRVGRDYDKDIALALGRLQAQGCRRPGFVDDPEVHHLMRLPLLRAALVYYHEHGGGFADAFHTVDLRRPAVLSRWLKKNRPDSLVMGIGFAGRMEKIHRLIAHLPQIELSPPFHAVAGREGFSPDYASMGRAAVELLHRAVTDGETGVPPHEKTMMVSSSWGLVFAGDLPTGTGVVPAGSGITGS